jgi:hypothetical protein
MIDYIVGGEYLNVTSNKGAVPYINMHRQSAYGWDVNIRSQQSTNESI